MKINFSSFKRRKEKMDEKKWIQDKDYTEYAEQIELEVGESVEGLLLDKFDFIGMFGNKNWGYIIQVKDKNHPVLLFGSTILNNKMSNKELNTEIGIERLPDKKKKDGTPYKFYNVYRIQE